jgi:hypothetical protein
MEEVDSPPIAVALMEYTHSIGYYFEYAVSDIVDNSINASARNIWITSLPSDNSHIAILDDGDGLDKDEL